MSKDIETTVAYWLDPLDGSEPDASRDIELVLGHGDEDNQNVLLHDIRGSEEQYSLDLHGFQTSILPKRERNVDGEAKEYFEELVEMIKDVTGAKTVLIFGKVIRRLPRDHLKPADFSDVRNLPKIQGPAPRPHVDFAPDNALHQMTTRVPGGAELIAASSRWAILGVWRPTKKVERDPLAISDFRSVPEDDYVNLKREGSWGKDANFVVTVMKKGSNSAAQRHKWHYWSEMMPEEVVIFKFFDSEREKEGKAWRCAHTSVPIPGTEHLPARESVEVRALVGY